MIIFPQIESIELKHQLIINKYEYINSYYSEKNNEEYFEKLIRNNFVANNKENIEEIKEKFFLDYTKCWRSQVSEIIKTETYNDFFKKYKIFEKSNPQYKIDFNKFIDKDAFVFKKVTNMKRFPTDEKYYEYQRHTEQNNNILNTFDLNQETQLEYFHPIKVLYKIEVLGKIWLLSFISDDIIGFVKESDILYINEKNRSYIEIYIKNKSIKNFTTENIKKFLQENMRIDYIWGKTDCSYIIKKYFENFGIFLPRNSSSQINSDKFEKIDIPDNVNKKEFIVENAKPFKSVVYLPGHIMLYCGFEEEKIGKKEPIFFHLVSSINMHKKSDENQNIIHKFFILSSIIGKLPDEIFIENNPSEYIPSNKFIIDRIKSIGNLKD